MTTERGSIHMPIATAVTAILILVYIFLLAVGRAGKWLRSFDVRGRKPTSRGRNAALTEPAETAPAQLHP